MFKPYSKHRAFILKRQNVWGYIDRKKLTGFSNNEKQYTKLEALGLAVVIGGPIGRYYELDSRQ